MFNKNTNVKDEIIVYSTKKELKKILNFIYNGLKDYNPSKDFKFKLSLVIEEIFINIVTHGYKNVEDNKVKTFYVIEEDPLAITVGFIDNGILFNPVRYMDNLDLYIDVIGSDYEKSSFGIILIKNNVDKIHYRTDGDRNILIFKKYFNNNDDSMV
ncbi:MAG: ATP-binding protein [Methanobrevibacter sp.]|jgi:anti-sigma regulatory factor (Ser/Thr protein kinase)|nr:ATP-binding protein [Candidatus Methanovirga aequatorialis]